MRGQGRICKWGHDRISGGMTGDAGGWLCCWLGGIKGAGSDDGCRVAFTSANAGNEHQSDAASYHVHHPTAGEVNESDVGCAAVGEPRIVGPAPVHHTGVCEKGWIREQRIGFGFASGLDESVNRLW